MAFFSVTTAIHIEILSDHDSGRKRCGILPKVMGYEKDPGLVVNQGQVVVRGSFLSLFATGAELRIISPLYWLAYGTT